MRLRHARERSREDDPYDDTLTIDVPGERLARIRRNVEGYDWGQLRSHGAAGLCLPKSYRSLAQTAPSSLRRARGVTAAIARNSAMRCA